MHVQLQTQERAHRFSVSASERAPSRERRHWDDSWRALGPSVPPQWVLGTGIAYVLNCMVVVLAGVGLARRGVTVPPTPVAGTAESGGAVVADSSAQPCETDRPPD
jgi:hypothetical protein